MWANFEGKARTREETLARINELRWTDWKPEGITLHNTAAPTLKQWAETGAAHDARIRNLQSYYENELGWHSGPHFFVSRNWINWFSNPLARGVHSRCWNATRFGIEMVGDYAVEEFNSGDGAMVRDNAVFLIAALNNKFGFKAEDLTFHKECTRDNHDCPGRKVVKSEVIALVKAEMEKLSSSTSGTSTSPLPIIPSVDVATTAQRVLFTVTGKMSTFGGPNDTGMSATEGLAIVPGLGRSLNSNTFYLACRWDYAVTPKAFLAKSVAYVEANGKRLAAKPVDWGPNARTGRVTDLSPGLAKALGLQTDDVCTVTVYADGK